jgi:methylthioribose-1-phosphate isomerase
VRGLRITPKGVKARHPAFDVTPAALITAIVTERGIARPPYAGALQRLIETAPTLAKAMSA